MSNEKQSAPADNLDQYISLLLSDDAALQQFVTHPEFAEQQHGISKADRAVLRRVIAGLSHKAKNGLSIQRDLGSYRRSLRLLQNVLHSHSAHRLAMQARTQQLVGADAKTLAAADTTSIQIYLTGNSATPGAPYDNPALAYTTYIHYSVTGSFNTIGEAMDFNPPSNPSINDTFKTTVSATVTNQEGDAGNLSYTAVYAEGASGPEWFMLSFSLSNFTGNINGTYELGYNEVTERQPFWYFSLNGAAISPDSNQGYQLTPGVIQGEEAHGFATFPLNSSHQIVWQGIAPDLDYGFAPCFTVNPGTTNVPYLLGIPILERNVTTPGETFYTNTVPNVKIYPDSDYKAVLSCNPDGSGQIRTDDEVFIYINNNLIYSHDYSQNCIGYITATNPVDISSAVQDYAGQVVTVDIKYQDRCGGKESSSGYFLVFVKK